LLASINNQCAREAFYFKRGSYDWYALRTLGTATCPLKFISTVRCSACGHKLAGEPQQTRPKSYLPAGRVRGMYGKTYGRIFAEHSGGFKVRAY